MSNVQFDEGIEKFTSRKILGEEVVPGMVKLLSKTGLAKDRNQAEYILVGTIIISIILTIIILYVTLKSDSSRKQPAFIIDPPYQNN